MTVMTPYGLCGKEVHYLTSTLPRSLSLSLPPSLPSSLPPSLPPALQICDPSGAAALEKLLKNVEVVFLERCGHVIPMDSPRECTQILTEFITRQVGGVTES